MQRRRESTALQASIGGLVGQNSWIHNPQTHIIYYTSLSLNKDRPKLQLPQRVKCLLETPILLASSSLRSLIHPLVISVHPFSR